MTNKDRAYKLLYDIMDPISPSYDRNMALILAYADEIRRECREELSAVKDKLCGIELNMSNYNDDDILELQNNMIEGVAMLAAIMGEEAGK